MVAAAVVIAGAAVIAGCGAKGTAGVATLGFTSLFLLVPLGWRDAAGESLPDFFAGCELTPVPVPAVLLLEFSAAFSSGWEIGSDEAVVSVAAPPDDGTAVP